MTADFSPLLFGMTALAVKVLVGLVFLAAGAGKIRHWSSLEAVVRNYRLLPGPLARPVALLLPPLELALGVALVVAAAPEAVLSASALLLVFAGAMAVNVLRGRTEIDCGCFQSDLRQTLGWPLVGRNLILAAALTSTAFAPPASGLWASLQGIAAGLVLFVLHLALDGLAATGPRLRLWAYPEEAAP